MTVKRVLSEKGSDVLTIQPHRTVLDAARLIAEKRIGALIVAEADKVVLGILSERDIVRAVSEKGAEALSLPLSHYMTKKVVTCTPAMTVRDVMSMMTQGKFRHVPVVENGHLVGIISIGDMVKQRLAEMEAEASAIRDYIVTA
jgi:CBS domain-containing protein